MYTRHTARIKSGLESSTPRSSATVGNPGCGTRARGSRARTGLHRAAAHVALGWSAFWSARFPAAVFPPLETASAAASSVPAASATRLGSKLHLSYVASAPKLRMRARRSALSDSVRRRKSTLGARVAMGRHTDPKEESTSRRDCVSALVPPGKELSSTRCESLMKEEALAACCHEWYLEVHSSARTKASKRAPSSRVPSRTRRSWSRSPRTPWTSQPAPDARSVAMRCDALVPGGRWRKSRLLRPFCPPTSRFASRSEGRRTAARVAATRQVEVVRRRISP
mmetsp:Transcript_1208/g.3363  ORF Transcript_1208/g.3363 Transcript_1208/m.3363 type:complete len:282 (+) Transcript_1208:231-1076(+)